MSRNKAIIATLTVVSAFTFAACQPSSTTTAVPSPSPAAMTAASPAMTETASASSHVMVEGEVKTTSEASYISPGGEEKILFNVYVDKAGVITDAEAVVEGKNPTTVMRQKAFAAEFPTALKGKKLSELTKVDRIGGSSLTTGAFNKALADLKSQI